MTSNYVKNQRDATGFPGTGSRVDTRLRHAAVEGYQTTDRQIIRRTSGRVILMRRCGSRMLPSRKRSRVFNPIKIGHAHESRTRTQFLGSVFVEPQPACKWALARSRYES